MRLETLLVQSARRYPGATAIVDAGEEITYRQLDIGAAVIAHRLRSVGVSAGDRVGLWMQKSWRTIAAMQGVLRVGAAYVPIEPTGPAQRGMALIADCDMAVVLTDPGHAQLDVVTIPIDDARNLVKC